MLEWYNRRQQPGLLTVTGDERVIANFFLTTSHNGVMLFVNPERFGLNDSLFIGSRHACKEQDLCGRGFYVSRAASFALTIRCFNELVEICSS